jgi:NhaA family Na+:H+ antiporter
MSTAQPALSASFERFVDSEKSGGIVLFACTVAALVLANSRAGPEWLAFWHGMFGPLSLEHWINDGLMALFFLLIGLELERELYAGELAGLRSALLPLVAAIGGCVLPALLHFLLNAGSPTQAGAGIPMATDIAFALTVLALLGNRVPPSLRVFLTALAVIDDLVAIAVIAMFYGTGLSLPYLAGALALFALLLVCNRVLHVAALVPYLVGGVLMWVLMLKSGVHATVAGVLLAFAIPFSSRRDGRPSPSERLEHLLHKPVAFVVLPLFALANTGVVIGAGWHQGLVSGNSLGILAGLVLGKPFGITVSAALAVAAGWCNLPPGVRWGHVIGAGLLSGIGFTVAIFIANLAFAGNAELVNASKLAIFAASLVSGLLGYAALWLGAGSAVAAPVR